MTTIIRIKRALQDEPLEALIVNCKRRKIDETSQSVENSSALFSFAGTISKEESPLKHIKKEPIDQNKLKHHINVFEKSKSLVKEASKNNRLKIVNSLRALETNADVEDNYTVVDVESNETKTNAENEQSYVYDIYTSHSNGQDFPVDNLDSVEPLQDVFCQYREADNDTEHESDDSNDENNWRNDYPDSDLDDEDILNAMYGCRLGGGGNDDDEEGGGELSTSDESFYGTKYDHDTALKHGKRYAQFKKRESSESDTDDEYGADRDEMFDDFDE